MVARMYMNKRCGWLINTIKSAKTIEIMFLKYERANGTILGNNSVFPVRETKF